MSDELLTKSEMAKYLRVSEITLDRWRKEGLPSIKFKRKVLFNKNEVLQWLKEKGKN